MKKLIGMLLGVFLVVSLAGCGGGGGGGTDDKKGAEMDKTTLTDRLEEVNQVGDGMSIVGNYIEQIAASFTPSMFAKSQNLISMGEDAEEEVEPPLEWTSERDKDGWYTAVTTYSEEGVFSSTVTNKMRYLTDTQTIEFSEIEECTYHDGSTYNYSSFYSISKGNNDLWNGRMTGEENDSHTGNHSSREVVFENLDLTNGCGNFTVSIDGSLLAEIVITLVDMENVRITGQYYYDGAPHEITETLPVCTDGGTGGTDGGEELEPVEG